MNWRRVIVVALSGLGALLLVAGAFMREPIVAAVGFICSFAGVAMLALMLSRQISWLASEVGGARGFIVDKVLTLGAQMKAHGGALAEQDAALARLRAQFVEYGHESRSDLRRRIDHLEATTTELLAVVSSDVRGLRGDVTGATAAQAASLVGEVRALTNDVTDATAAQAVGLTSLKKSLEERIAELASNAEVHARHIEKLQDNADALLGLQGEIRAEVADGANLAMRTYRELVEMVEDSARRLGLGQEQASERVLEGLGGVARQADVLSAMEEASRLIGASHDESSQRLLAAMEGAAKTDEVVAGLDLMKKANADIEALRSLMIDTHQADKRELLAFMGDEKKLRKVSQLSMQWLKTEILKEIEALSQLRTLLRVEGATPLLGGWAMDAAAVHSLIGIVRERRPLRIVELGSGSSTVWLALALRSIGRGRIVSFDHIELYGQRTMQAIRDQRLEEFAEVRVRELISVEIGGEHFEWYDIADSDALGPIDILLVDGPPGATGPMARFPAVPVLWPELADDALIIVDDSGRPDERKMLTAWCEAFPDLEEPEAIGARTMLIRRRPTRPVRAKKK